MSKKITRRARRKRIHLRSKGKISGSPERPRICVFKSLNNIYVSAVDDTVGSTLISFSTLSKELKGNVKHGGNVASAKSVGEIMAQKLLDKGIKKAVFDRSGYLYHGRVKAVAEALREKGLIN